MSYVALGTSDLVVAASLLLINILLSIVLRLGLAKGILLAAVQMVVQLSLLGLVLHWVFAVRNPLIVLGMAGVMALFASIAAVRRTSRRFPGIYWHSLIVILASSFLVTGFTVFEVVEPDPWFEPQYFIPLHGMLLGNALTGISLGLDRFMEGCAERRGRIETVGMVLQIHPDAVEAHQARQLEQRRIGQMKGRHQDGLVPGEFGFDATGSHWWSFCRRGGTGSWRV
ncbi:MAG: ABC transporter permease, partial [Acidobacteria bacterium]|nr:ABC transporter permease [Acidobacteriota bacterium]